MAVRRIPTATYRLQLTSEFTFDDAAQIVPYLHQLGISDLYLSPIFAARSGSQHGYDGIDPTRISSALGGAEGFANLTATARAHDIGVLLDIVPNHLAASVENAWWLDVLRHGQRSPFAPVFDIDWAPPGAPYGSVLLPILGERFGVAFEAGQLRLTFDEHGVGLQYFDWFLPIRPESYRTVFNTTAHSPATTSFATALNEVEASAAAPARFAAAVSALWQEVSGNPELASWVARRLEALNGAAGRPTSFDELERLLGEQHYQLAYWRTANETINYRRFFDINDLVGVRAEDPAVFELTHSAVRELLQDDSVSGLRIDHIDGLHDPLDYLQRLQAINPGTGELFVLVEKILVGREELPEAWPVAGTTGYEFLNTANGLFTDRTAAIALDQIYSRTIGGDTNFMEVVYRQKRRVIQELFSAPLDQLTALLHQVAQLDRQGLDLTRRELREALAELTVWFPVYRTYLRETEASYTDRARIEEALSAATVRRPELTDALRFAGRVLTLVGSDHRPSEARTAQIELVARWQQFSGPVMAKGFEDTSLYIYTWLISFNAVGGEPDAIALSSDDAHRWLARRAERWPHSMNASSTHDSKRGEDVNARINVLTELTSEWAARLERWRAWNALVKWHVDGRPVPDGAFELLLYQSLLGAWPLDGTELTFVERLKTYAVKAAREAKTHTSWLDPHDEYEQALLHFIDAILEPGDDNPFVSDFLELLGLLARDGALNALSQTLLKVTAPGLPDFYQGTELWSLTFVDPDNRGLIDYGVRRQMLTELLAVHPDNHLQLASELLDEWADGRTKLWLTQRALTVRRRLKGVFEQGAYLPLSITGERRRHAFALARQRDRDWAVVVFPRLALRLRELYGLADGWPLAEPAWADTALALPADAPHHWVNELTGESHTLERRDERAELPLARLFQAFPFALLTPSGAT